MAQPRAFVRRKDMIGVRAVSSDERYELSARLVEAEESELNLLDVILEGTTHEGEHVYVAVEASVTGDDHDIQRAHTRALLLAKATNSRVLPLVVCVEEPKQQLIELAQQHQVALARKQRGVFLQAPLTSFNPT
ncbi:hypothetical protein [Ferrimicrobium sp.]|uniref:hypothetical protein n=1 Tax=Ferrimicrobium sp. TaxID=2926050 RepID=UPI00262D6DE8|nr:hypothetical protein [Ferrimicrobium sp.]